MIIVEEKKEEKVVGSLVERSWSKRTDEELKVIRSNMKSEKNKKRVDQFIARRNRVLLN